MADEQLGFAASVDISKASASLSALEASIRRLEQSMAGMGTRSKVNLIDDGAVARSMGGIGRSFGMLERMGHDVTTRMDQDWGLLASATSRRAGAIASSVIDSLQDVDRQLMATEKRIHAVEQAGSRMFSGHSLGPALASIASSGAKQQPRSTSFTAPQTMAGVVRTPFAQAAGFGRAASLLPPGARMPLIAGAIASGIPLSGPGYVPPTSRGPGGPGSVFGGFGSFSGSGGGGWNGPGFGGGGAPPPRPPLTPPAPAPAPPPLPAPGAAPHHAPPPSAPASPSSGGKTEEKKGGGLKGFMSGVGSTMAGIGGLIGLGGMMSYISDAVRDNADEAVHTANMSTRLGGGSGAAGFGGMATGQGRGLMFTRAESLEAASALGGSRGTSFSGGTNASDLGATFRVARGLGMDGAEAGSKLGGMERSGVFKGGEARRFSAELAATIDRSSMMPRAAEAMEAAASILGEVSGRIGDLTDGQRTGLLAMQGQLAQGSEMFRGERGAQMINKMGNVVAPGGGDDISETMINMAIVRGKGGKNSKMDAEDVMKYREGGHLPEILGFVGQQANAMGGGNAKTTRHLFRQSMHGAVNFSQTAELEKLTSRRDGKGNIIAGTAFTNWGDRKGINAIMGEGTISRGIGKQGGKAAEVREVQQLGDDMKKKVGETFFPIFKETQKFIMGAVNVMADKVMPAIGALWKGIVGTLEDIRKNGIMTVFDKMGKQLMAGLESIFKDMKKRMFGDEDPATAAIKAAIDKRRKEGGFVNNVTADGIEAFGLTAQQKQDVRFGDIRKYANSYEGGVVSDATLGDGRTPTLLTERMESEGLVVKSDVVQREDREVFWGDFAGPLKRGENKDKNTGPHHKGGKDETTDKADVATVAGQGITVGKHPLKFISTDMPDKHGNVGGGGIMMHFMRMIADGKGGLKESGVVTSIAHLSAALKLKHGVVYKPGTDVAFAQAYNLKQSGHTTGPHLHEEANIYLPGGKKGSKVKMHVPVQGDWGLSDKQITDEGLRLISPHGLPTRKGGLGIETGKQLNYLPSGPKINRTAPTVTGQEEPPPPGGRPAPAPQRVPGDGKVSALPGGTQVAAGGLGQAAAGGVQILVMNEFKVNGGNLEDVRRVVGDSTQKAWDQAAAKAIGMNTVG